MELGRCKLVDWDGSVGGIDIHMTYKLDTGTTYYVVDVTLTNTTADDIDDVYFYKTFDPDNNQPIGWSFMTTNTIEFQPTPFCPKSLVSATQTSSWDNYVGFGAIDPDTRVSWGGFSVPSGSDIWNASGGLTGGEGETTFCDCAISICHKDATLAAGESSNFQFVVIMSSEQVEEAIQSLYFVDYPDSPGALASCTAEYIDIDDDGELELVPDTVEIDCSSGPVELSLDGPYIGPGYEITWYNEDTGEEVGEGATITILPGDAAMYRVIAEPVGDCFELPIERYTIIVGIGIGPNIILEDPGPQCFDVDLDDLVFYDDNGLPDLITEFYSEYPDDGIGDPDGIWPDGDLMSPGDEVFILMGDPVTGCYDIKLVVIDWIEVDAGLDSTGHLMCNSGVETVDLHTFLVDTIILASEGYMWEEITPTFGGFNPITGEFDPTGLAAGDYDFRFIGLGGMICVNDTSIHTITVYHQPEAGEDNVAQLCNVNGEFIDLNTLLSGHEPGGTWSEVDATGGSFDPATGILTLDGTLPAGDYVFEYTLTATAPCLDDVAQFTITINALPLVNAGPDQSICIGDATAVTASGDPATYVWDAPGVVNGLAFTPTDLGPTTYRVTATDANGCVNMDSLVIDVHALPVISFVADTLFGCTPLDVNFTVSSDQVISTVDWTFGDGDVAFGMLSPSVSHTYLFEGIYEVSVTVTDEFGCVSSVAYADYIEVKTQPVAAFTMDPQSVFTNDTEVDFTNESLHATEYVWDFGDGSDESNVENPTHFFPEDPGDVFYPVTLTASNSFGCPDVANTIHECKRNHLILCSEYVHSGWRSV